MIFIDSSLIIGIVLAKDQWHNDAVEIARLLEHDDKITSDLVITEVMSTIGSKKGGKESLKVFNYMLEEYTVYSTDLKHLKASMFNFLKYDGKLSLVDASILNIMKKLKINKIASFDSDFDNKVGVIRINKASLYKK